MTDAAMAMPTRRVDLVYAGTAPQGRLSVGFRIILAIPQIIVLYFLFLAVFFVAVIGWFAALFTGRLPEWAHGFISGVVRWSTRVGAYLFLLTDRYPPFSLDDEDYPARPILPGPGGELNRWSVLFRFVLAVPGAAFMQIVEYGLTTPLLLVMWIVVLVTGSMPPTLYLAYAALLRYQARFHSWFGMLTSEYPWGMLGDRVPPGSVPSGPSPPVVPAGPAPAPGGAPPYQAPPPPATPAQPPHQPAQPFSYPPASDAPDQAPSPEEPAAPRPEPAAPPPRRLASAHARATAGGRRGHAATVAVGADRGAAATRWRAAAVGHARPRGCGAELDDLRHRLGIGRVRGAGRRPACVQRASAQQLRRGPALRRGPPR